MNIYISNLVPGTTEEEVRSAFAAFGSVASVKLIKDLTTGAPKGFGFIDMPEKTEALEAIHNMDGSFLSGSVVTVSEANNSSRDGSRDSKQAKAKKKIKHIGIPIRSTFNRRGN